MFAPTDAIELIETLEKNGHRVLAVDGFFLTEKTVQPSIKNSLNFSTDVVGRDLNLNQVAVRFIKDRQLSGLHFEIEPY